MALDWTNKATVSLAAAALVLGLYAAPAMAAKGESSHETRSEAVEKGQGNRDKAETAQVDEQEDEVECESADDSAATTDPAVTTDPAATTDPAVTTDPATTTDPVAPCSQPATKEKASVNLSDKGKSAEHNPNVDAQGNLVPGSASGKEADDAQQAAEVQAAPEQVKAEHVAKVKDASRAKAKEERSKGEKGAYLVYVNGEKLNLTPLARNGRTLVPFRKLAETLGATVSWEPSTRTVTMVMGDQTISFAIDGTTATVNGETVDMPVPPELVEGSTFVPLRFIATALGADVDYDVTTGAITVITSPETAPAPAPAPAPTEPAPAPTEPAPAPTEPAPAPTEPAPAPTEPAPGN